MGLYTIICPIGVRNLNQKASQWKLFFYGVRYGSKR
nr:MAG TPA: hypothetical protein [Caudoviricetes sp.]DAR86790.1 MAG TPA: hypothetical protein [Caudoviricetes sp.]DAU02233.1 MAG TPA: hypothetical protein [Caudoviricetes sp.]